MGKKKIITFLLIIMIIIVIIISLPIIKSKKSCQKGDELNDYLSHCDKKTIDNAYAMGNVPMLPRDCRDYRNEQDSVIGQNGKKYKNSCYACRDCQKYFYKKTSILKLILNKIKN